mmetsp:Transcript_40683/g.69433  ORF Transcript_40683/g.69433 Transcript_40683/m.69433 type:complete len:90 (+) Transcript_40683:167-436(+)
MVVMRINIVSGEEETYKPSALRLEGNDHNTIMRGRNLLIPPSTHPPPREIISLPKHFINLCLNTSILFAKGEICNYLRYYHSRLLVRPH